MHVIHTAREMHEWSLAQRAAGKKIGFVPTMGYLHRGHLELMKFQRARCDVLVASIFVNPTQFGPGEDFGAYPRDLDRDTALATEAAVDCLFFPAVAEIYPPGYRTYIDVELLSDTLCGAHRPGHFRGVCTVVAKLFNIVAPDEASFGEKDAQQLRIIRKMTEDLNVPVKVLGFPTVREADGLAMSSRNVYLTPGERAQAIALYRSLGRAQTLAAGGETDTASIIEQMRTLITSDAPAAQIEYIEAVDDATLQPVTRLEGPTLIAMAVRVGKARLIDNVLVDRNKEQADARG